MIEILLALLPSAILMYLLWEERKEKRSLREDYRRLERELFRSVTGSPILPLPPILEGEEGAEAPASDDDLIPEANLPEEKFEEIINENA